jgi:predicted small secreted protein
MKHTFNIYLSVVILSTTFFSCQNNLRVKGPDYKIRPLKDTIALWQE